MIKSRYNNDVATMYSHYTFDDYFSNLSGIKPQISGLSAQLVVEWQFKI